MKSICPLSMLSREYKSCTQECTMYSKHLESCIIARSFALYIALNDKSLQEQKTNKPEAK